MRKRKLNKRKKEDKYELYLQVCSFIGSLFILLMAFLQKA